MALLKPSFLISLGLPTTHQSPLSLLLQGASEVHHYFVLGLRDVSQLSMASVPEERQSGILECSMGLDMFTKSDTQIGGGHHELLPVIVTPTHLCHKIKATGRDTGLV
ncbi:hypothetical protein PISMIDRAFT_22853 [Pisolithus microcarpus 441]|uniref:Uncharacterized protein n=1 Tax=Pisolithus microcarpus 441 TaxID=765257 RepID=A0A0C9Z7N8_9AGAM|nr:hypothetical protein PISMIDRAFT_22853 [Pisolithus microcarpus 441]